MSEGRRTKLDIMNDILTSIQQEGGEIKPTRLLYKSNLSYKKLIEYTTELISKGMLIEYTGGEKRSYRITDKGISFIQEFRKIKEFIDAFGL